MPDVFLSYHHQDGETARRIVRALEKRGLDVFYDRDVLLAGQDFSDAIPKAIRDARVVVVLLSRNSGQSQWVRKELATALEADREKRIIPVWLDEQATENWVWPLIANRQAIDLTTSDDQDLIDAVVRATGTGKEGNSDVPRAELAVPASSRGKYSLALLAIAASVLVLYFETQTSDVGVTGWLLIVGAVALGFGSGFLLRSGNK